MWEVENGSFSFIFVGAFVRLMVSKNKYEQDELDLSRLQKGDVILTGTNKNISSFQIKISNILTNGMDSKFWTHAALHVGEGKIIEARPGGIRYYSVQEYLQKGVLIKAYRNKYIDNSLGEFAKLVEFCEKQKEKDSSYGKVGLLFYTLASFLPVSMNFIFNSDFVDKCCNLDNAYFCSELVADAYKETGHRISEHDSWRIKPSDFIRNPFFEEVILAQR